MGRDTTADDEQLAFIAKLMRVARDEGARHVRVGEIEVDMAVTRNPLAADASAAGRGFEQKREPQHQQQPNHRPPLRQRDELDAMGNAVPVLIHSKIGGGG